MSPDKLEDVLKSRPQYSIWEASAPESAARAEHAEHPFYRAELFATHMETLFAYAEAQGSAMSRTRIADARPFSEDFTYTATAVTTIDFPDGNRLGVFFMRRTFLPDEGDAASESEFTVLVSSSLSISPEEAEVTANQLSRRPATSAHSEGDTSDLRSVLDTSELRIAGLGYGAFNTQDVDTRIDGALLTAELIAQDLGVTLPTGPVSV